MSATRSNRLERLERDRQVLLPCRLLTYDACDKRPDGRDSRCRLVRYRSPQRTMSVNPWPTAESVPASLSGADVDGVVDQLRDHGDRIGTAGPTYSDGPDLRPASITLPLVEQKNQGALDQAAHWRARDPARAITSASKICGLLEARIRSSSVASASTSLLRRTGELRAARGSRVRSATPCGPAQSELLMPVKHLGTLCVASEWRSLPPRLILVLDVYRCRAPGDVGSDDVRQVVQNRTDAVRGSVA